MTYILEKLIALLGAALVLAIICAPFYLLYRLWRWFWRLHD